MCEPSTEAVNIDYPRKHPYRAVWVVGSCNGLICIAINEKDLFLWNPSTRISTKLPPVEVKMIPGFYNIFGFGYNESSDDYKVLGIFCAFGNVGVYESVVKLYSLKTNSWKRIEDFKGGEPLDDSGKFAGGKLHFSTIRGIGLDFRWDIVSLDLDTEAYGILEQPDYGEGPLESSLGVVGGCICILCNYEKFVRILVYNPQDNCLRHPETSNLGAFLEADVYIESLISPAASEELRYLAVTSLSLLHSKQVIILDSVNYTWLPSFESSVTCTWSRLLPEKLRTPECTCHGHRTYDAVDIPIYRLKPVRPTSATWVTDDEELLPIKGLIKDQNVKDMQAFKQSSTFSYGNVVKFW
ncbi:UNVERIFIED_CONTAM: F-box protein CPR1 [Sesamum calycinum]|uniref:F-box protein CPR1 n=1 Tax=Sesamum calycinum TaxID=2727403 RepID=A0AAW2SW41_9LAMI